MNIVIIGAGQAAATLAFKLRELDFTGEITIFGNESVYPYQRPPLSKNILVALLPGKISLYVMPQPTLRTIFIFS